MYWLFEKTIMSILTAFVILLINKITAKKINPLWHYYIWFILLLQLLLPVLPQSNISISILIPLNKLTGNLQKISHTNLIDTAEKLDITTQNNIFSLLNLHTVVIIVWILGTLSFMAYFILKYMNFRRNISKFNELDKDEVLFTFESIKNKLNINREIPILEYKNSPMIVGFFKPILLMPKDYDSSELEGLFYHELLHYKHFDTVLNWITIFARCIFWFNPIIWYSFKVMQNDCELACDYYVVKSMGIQNRKLYASTLLKYATINMESYNETPILGIPSMADNESEIKKRIYHISNFKKYSIPNTFLVIIVITILSVACLTKVNADVKDLPLKSNSKINFSTDSDLKNIHLDSEINIESTTGSSLDLNSSEDSSTSLDNTEPQNSSENLSNNTIINNNEAIDTIKDESSSIDVDSTVQDDTNVTNTIPSVPSLNNNWNNQCNNMRGQGSHMHRNGHD